MNVRVVWMALMGLWVCSPAFATEVYRHVDKNGVVHYSDQPPTKNAKPVVLPPIQIISPASTVEEAGSGASANGSLDKDEQALLRLGANILSPKPEETFRGDDRRLNVSVSLDEPLPEGYGLLYLLDGTPQNQKATRALSYTLEGVERGEHLLSVATVDAKGREVARGAPVIVHMKPPTSKLADERRQKREDAKKPKDSERFYEVN